MRFGAHVSVAKGYLSALDYAESVGCECMQIFAKSPRQWNGPEIDPDAAKAFVEHRAARGFGPVFTHAAYLINLATDDPLLRTKSITALADELTRGSLLAAAGVVCHVGNDPAGDEAAAADRVAEAVIAAFDAAEKPVDTRLLLENTAGAGRSFGSTFAQLGAAIARTGLPSWQLGVCLDTCHAFAFGMPVDSEAGWREVIGELDARCRLDRLGLIHANDCLFERGSRRDRHAWIGEGRIDEAGFSAMVCAPRLAEVPVCVEMPGELPEKDRVNLGRLKALRERCAS